MNVTIAIWLLFRAPHLPVASTMLGTVRRANRSVVEEKSLGKSMEAT
jgi:hypothetical protein